ncbi:MAG: hypothetical protein GC192_00460 [Bacteroidetes bacterium]|nr:hypothetical protein [Bacteroidota bacterium]
MKFYLKTWICLLLAAFMAPVFLSANLPDNYYGLPGDDFSLEGALDLFKSSNSLEEFERKLNSDDYNVNNLDLNHNGRIDYLRVVDHAEGGDMHAIVIQALVDNGVSQDVAVIEVKRNRYGEAVVQIVGDEDLYGTAKIVEPYPYDDMVGTDYYDNYYDHYSPTIFVNAWSWPSVRFIFAPRYVVWVSPYYYNYYPVWYHTWNPHPYHVWHTRTVVYHHYYCVAPNYRIPEVHHYYGARRVSAPVVHQRTERYVAEHGGRSNFNYGKRSNSVESPRTRSIDRSENATASNLSDRQREQQSTTKPQASNRATPRSAQPKVAEPNTKQREQNPTVKSQTSSGNSTHSNIVPDSKQREKSPVVQPQKARPQTENRQQQGTRNAATASKSKTESNNRQLNSSVRGTTQRANNSTSNQRSSSAKNSSQPQAKVQRQPTPPAVSRSAPSSRTGNSSVGKSSTKNERSQPRKGKG